MAMEKEALTHRIEDDLAARNRNWDKIDTHMAENEQQFSNIDSVLKHYLKPTSVPYSKGDERWRDVGGIGFYHCGVDATDKGYPTDYGTLLHMKLPVTSLVFQVYFGSSGQIWSRRVIANRTFAETDFVAV